jgi:hypothetical protein
MSTEVTQEKLLEIIAALNTSRSVVHVCATALWTGDDHSDLELHCATMLSGVSEALDEAYDELSSMRLGLAMGEGEPS